MAQLLPKQYAKILYQLTKDASEKDLDRIIRTYVEFLKKERAIKKIDFIVAEFVAHVKKIEGIMELDVRATKALSKKTKDALRALFGSDAEVNETIDASILGGLVVRAGNVVFDGSLKKQLKKLKEHMSN